MKLTKKTNIIYLDLDNERFIKTVFDLVNSNAMPDQSNKIFYSHADVLLQSVHQMQKDDCIEQTSKEPPVWEFFIILDMGHVLSHDKTTPPQNVQDTDDPGFLDTKKLWQSFNNVCAAIRNFSDQYGFYYNVYAVWMLPELFGFSKKYRTDVGKELKSLAELLKTKNQSGPIPYNFLFIPDNRYQKLNRTDYQSLIRTFLATFISSHASDEIKRFLEANLLEITSQQCFFSVGISMLNNTSTYQQDINLDQSCNIFLDNIKKQKIGKFYKDSDIQLFIDNFFSESKNFYTYLQDDEYIDNSEITDDKEFLYDFIYKIHEKIDAGKIYDAFHGYFETWFKNQIIENHFMCGNIFREIEGFKLYLEQQLSRVIAQDKEILIDDLITERFHPKHEPPKKKTFFQKIIDSTNKFSKILFNKNIAKRIGLLKPIFIGCLCSILFLIYNGLIYWFFSHRGVVQGNKILIFGWTGVLFIIAVVFIIIHKKIIAEMNKPKIVKHTFVNIPRFLPQKFVTDIHHQICGLTTKLNDTASAALENIFSNKRNIQNHSSSLQDRSFPAGLSLIDSMKAKQLFVNEKPYIKKMIDSYFLEYNNSHLKSPGSLKDQVCAFVTNFEKLYMDEIANEVFLRQMSSMEHELLLDRKKMLKLKDGLLRESGVFAIMFHQDFKPDYLIFPSQNGENGFKGSYQHEDFLYRDMVNNLLQGSDVFNTPLIQIKGPFSIEDLAYFHIACDENNTI